MLNAVGRRVPAYVAAMVLPTLLAAASAVFLFFASWVGQNGFHFSALSGDEVITFASQFWTFSVFGFMEHVYLFLFWLVILPLIAIFFRPDWRLIFVFPYLSVPLWLFGSVLIFIGTIVLWNVALKIFVFGTLPDLQAIFGILKIMFMNAFSR